MPSRWERAQVGEPTAIVHNYTNYVIANPDSLFHPSNVINEKYKDQLFDYPGKVFDYHYLNRTLSNFELPNQSVWNHDLQLLNSRIGAYKEVNIVIILVKNHTDDFYHAQRKHWLGGKKNDAIIVVGVEDDLSIKWARVMAWAKKSIFQIVLQDDILAMKKLNLNLINIIATNIENNFERKPMAEFEYLMSSIQPTTTGFIVGLIILLVISIGVSTYFVVADPFYSDEGVR